MRIRINSGLGDAVWFLPFAVELSRKGQLEILGNRYSADVCALANLQNVSHDPSQGVMNPPPPPPPGATVARIRRYGEKNYREIYSEATGCAGHLELTWAALGVWPETPGKSLLLLDAPRLSGLGAATYTPNINDFNAELLKVGGQYENTAPVGHFATLGELFARVAGASAGIGQIGFLTALCYLFDKPFYAVRANNEPGEKFAARKKVVCL